ncbi:hypothetical protein ACFLSJ_08855 [Verrucomicrobiota bacterium]
MSPTWKQIRTALRDSRADAAMSDASDFWPEFRARAGLRSRDTVVVPVHSRAPARWAVAAACVVLVAALTFFTVDLRASAAPLSSIKSLEVIASHSAVLIMNDEPSDSTILWIVGMELGEEQGGAHGDGI